MQTKKTKRQGDAGTKWQKTNRADEATEEGRQGLEYTGVTYQQNTGEEQKRAGKQTKGGNEKQNTTDLQNKAGNN